MRVISGTFKGRQLFTPKDLSVRPTTDKVRNAVFSVLFDTVEGAHVLDLFCGTGSYGIEAISRGADKAVFVDTDVTFVKKNIKDMEDSTDIIKGDVIKILPTLTGKFDVIFIDPPYGKYAPAELLGMIADGELLAEGGTIVFEESFRSPFDVANTDFFIENEKKYGDTKIYYLAAGGGGK
ncbi:16S rRNA (guanine(966)-N(2))-methyltransferase RsmD [Seleniivibrio sp.]|uniref:16S rRNA (guanine(966)-N(2))-methyltransferase RsmD n=1 Tax=Seleniivibrio sp. TaxID=2898801 RepID=UPI0025FEE610|nr:16S rRNA (guanine(966)-N(2))-methyltransferase RsmD [Seleniivibrio sp.]MCD8552597.1 16S rRNA (guanine(966)-N(2))-methyltransferase RsmD [Seleniivibrio sp.]